jgi:hypothetical protein
MLPAEGVRLSGKTDAEGGFSLALPWPGFFARGKLRSFPLPPFPSPPSGFPFVSGVPGGKLPRESQAFAWRFRAFFPPRSSVSRFFSFADQTHFLLGEIELEEAEISWDPARPLRWEDFRGEPPPGSHSEGAQIHLSLSWSGEWEVRSDRGRGVLVAKLVSIATANTMDRAKSWVLPQAKTQETLNHEQRHFDLNEVYRRLLELSLRKFLGTEVTGATREEAESKLKAMLNAVFKRVVARCQEIQSRYDRETDHGRNLQKQREWDRWISEWLSDPLRAPQP